MKTRLLSLLCLLALAVSTVSAAVVELTSETGEVMLQDGDELTGTGGRDVRVRVAAGAMVTLNGVRISSIPDDSQHNWSGITCLGDATLVLAEGSTNVVRGGSYERSAITVAAGSTLTITGKGTLRAYGTSGGTSLRGSCAIGAGVGETCGNIVIEDGMVIANGGNHSAGIGTSTVANVSLS